MAMLSGLQKGSQPQLQPTTQVCYKCGGKKLQKSHVSAQTTSCLTASVELGSGLTEQEMIT